MTDDNWACSAGCRERSQVCCLKRAQPVGQPVQHAPGRCWGNEIHHCLAKFPEQDECPAQLKGSGLVSLRHTSASVLAWTLCREQSFFGERTSI